MHAKPRDKFNKNQDICVVITYPSTYCWLYPIWGGEGEDQKSQTEEIGNIGLSGTRLNKKPLARVDRGD